MGKKEKNNNADPHGIESINPFVNLPTAPPTEAPSKVAANSKRESGHKSGQQSSIPPGQGAPPTPGKPGWRRVSTRQWIRDFRDHIAKYQSYPYKNVCGMFFWSFGYYPDMVPHDSYQRYISRHPITNKRHSASSDEDVFPITTESELFTPSTTDMAHDSASKTGMDNKILPPLLPPLVEKKEKKTDGPGSAPTETETDAKDKKEKNDKLPQKGKVDPTELDHAAGSPEVDHPRKSRKTKRKTELEIVEGMDKKGKAKGKRSRVGGDALLDAGGDAEEGKKGKGKKGKKKPSVAASGNLSLDPQIYDLTTLTVMNLPASADEKQLNKLFPGGKVKMEEGGASIKFSNAALAEPFFTKDISLDGNHLVVSAKLLKH